jgi:hypothetical protein
VRISGYVSPKRSPPAVDEVVDAVPGVFVGVEFDNVGAFVVAAALEVDGGADRDEATRRAAPLRAVGPAAGLKAAVRVKPVFQNPCPMPANKTESMQPRKSVRRRVEVDGMAQSPRVCMEGVPAAPLACWGLGYRQPASAVGGRER